MGLMAAVLGGDEDGTLNRKPGVMGIVLGDGEARRRRMNRASGVRKAVAA
jgi:hypothetical protein